MSGSQDDGIHPTVLAGRSDHHYLAAARDLGRDGVHQHRGGIGGGATGYVQSCPIHGNDLLADDHTVFFVEDEAVPHLLFVEAADIDGRLFQDREEFPLHLCEGFLHFLLGNRQGGKTHAVKFLAVFVESGVADLPHAGDNFRHRIRNGFGRGGAGKDGLRFQFAVIQYAYHCIASI